MPQPLVIASEWSWRLLLIVAAGALAMYAVIYLKVIVIPIIIGLFLATLLVPPANRLVKLGWSRTLATVVVFLGSLLLLIGLAALLGPQIAREVSDLRGDLGQGTQQLGSLLAESSLGITQAQVDDALDQSGQWLRDNSSRISGGIFSGAALVAEIIAGALLTLVLLFFYIKDGPSMWRWLVGLFPSARQPYARRLGENAWDTLGAYLRGLAIVAAFDAIVIGIVLLIFGVPLVLPLSLLIFFSAFLPLVGAFLSGLVAVLVALVAQGPLVALAILVAIIIIQQLEGDVLYPLVVGRKVQLHAVATLLAVAAGAVVGGIVGAFLAVPVAAVLYAEYVYLRRRGNAQTNPKVKAEA